MVRDVLQDIVEVVPVLIGDKHPARATVDLREALAGGANGRRIDDRHHLIEMVANQAIKEGFVGVLNVAQVNMLVDLSFKSLVLDPCAFSLFLNCFNNFWQQAEQVKAAALFHAEGATFVEKGKFEQNGASVGDIQGTVFLMGELHRTNSLMFTSDRARR